MTKRKSESLLKPRLKTIKRDLKANNIAWRTEEPGYRKIWITPKEAVIKLLKVKIKVSKPTFVSWVKKYKLGHKVGGRWVVLIKKLDAFIKEYF